MVLVLPAGATASWSRPVNQAGSCMHSTACAPCLAPTNHQMPVSEADQDQAQVTNHLLQCSAAACLGAGSSVSPSTFTSQRSPSPGTPAYSSSRSTCRVTAYIGRARTRLARAQVA